MSESSKEELKQKLDEYPTEAHRFFKHGFKLAVKLSEETRRKLLNELIENLRQGKRRVSGSALPSIANLSSSDSERIFSTYTIIIGLLSETSVSPDEFIEVAQNILFDAEDSNIVKSIVTPICENRSDINSAVQYAQLASRVLPSFQKLELVVDLRFKFADGKIKNQVPIAIAYLSTDESNQRLWFQMTKGDLQETVKALNDALSQMAQIESSVVNKK